MCSEAFCFQIITIWHDWPDAAETDSMNKPLESSEDWQLALAWCWLRVHLSMTCLPKMLFVIMSIGEEEIKKRTPVPQIVKTDRECRADCLLSITYKPSPHCVLGSHAPFPVTLLYTRRSSPAECSRNFPLHFIHPPCHVFDSLCYSECSAFTSCKVPASKHHLCNTSPIAGLLF